MDDSEAITAPAAPRFAPDTGAPGEGRARLLALLTMLDAAGYDFLAPTPATQRRQMARADRLQARNLVDLLGWSLPIEPGVLDPEIEAGLLGAGALSPEEGGLLRPLLRASRVEGALFWHSPYPTRQQDAVFLGPDSYRFAQFILANMPESPRTILDYGAGAGVGGIIAARRAPGSLLTIADINPVALYLASINAEHAGVAHQVVKASRPAEFADSRFALIVSHPPFMLDREHRIYRDGGDLHGARLSLDWLREGAALLAPGGRLVMHTGSAVIEGRDVLKTALVEEAFGAEITIDYREIEPDIFGNELSKPEYASVERIAAVGVVIDRSG